MTLFERIHQVIKTHLGRSADENTPVDTEALTSEVIGAHNSHYAGSEKQPEEKAAES